jgi:hypothetical protein
MRALKQANAMFEIIWLIANAQLVILEMLLIIALESQIWMLFQKKILAVVAVKIVYAVITNVHVLPTISETLTQSADPNA